MIELIVDVRHICNIRVDIVCKCLISDLVDVSARFKITECTTTHPGHTIAEGSKRDAWKV